MADIIERVKTGIFEMLQRSTWKDIDNERHRFQPVLNDALKVVKDQQAINELLIKEIGRLNRLLDKKDAEIDRKEEYNMIRVYEKRFNEKVDSFKDHPKYATLRKSADEALKYHTGYGLKAIRSQDFMHRIVKMPLIYIREWMDGKNSLEWLDPKTGENYDAVNLADVLNNPIK